MFYLILFEILLSLSISIALYSDPDDPTLTLVLLVLLVLLLASSIYLSLNQDFRVEVNQGQTTTFFLKTEVPARFGSRPLGLITESKGVFVNDGTTTEYATQIVGTSIDGVYAKIQSTESRVYSLISDAVEDETTGVVSSTTVTRIRGQTTTIETTQLVRTFIDDVYAQEIITGTEIFAPLTIEPTAVLSAEPQQTVEIDGSQTAPHEDVNGGLVFKTSHLTQIVGERVVELSAESHSHEEDEEDESAVTEEDRKKVIATFSEDETDASRRGMRKLEEEEVTKPPVVLQTIQARTQFESPAPVSAEIAAGAADEEAPSTDKPETESHDELLTIPTVEEEVEPSTEEPVLATQSTPTDDGDSVEEDDDEDAEKEAEIETEKEATVPVEVETESKAEEEAEVAVEVVAAVEAEKAVEKEAEIEIAPAVIEAVQPVVSTIEAVAALPGIRAPRIEVSTGIPFVVIAASGAVDEAESKPQDKASVVIATLNITSSGEEAKAEADPTGVVSPSFGVEPNVTLDESSLIDIEGSMEDTTESGIDVTVATPVDGLTMTTRLTTFTLFTTELVTTDGTTSSVVKTREVVSTQVEVIQATPTTADTAEGDFTTLFTTYTYFSTLFDDKTTKLINREEIVSNVVAVADLNSTATPVVKTQDVTSTPDDGFSPVSVQSSIDDESQDRKNFKFLGGLPKGIAKAFLTTFTFYTTELISGTTVVSSRIVISSNTVTPTIQLDEIDEELWESLKAKDDARKALKVSVKVMEKIKPIEATVEPSSPSVGEITPAVELAETETPSGLEEKTAGGDMTTLDKPVLSTVPVFVVGPSTPGAESTTESILTSSDEGDFDTTTPIPEEMDATTPIPEEMDATEEPVTEEMQTDMVSTEEPQSVEVSSEVPQIPEETTSDIAPTPPTSEKPSVDEDGFTPLIEPSVTSEPVTFYTTFTYFTTVFTEGTSSLVSRKEIISNVASDGATTAEIPTVFPTTYYTTYTYRTTSVINDQETVFTREETVSNVITPGVEEATQIGETSTVAVVPTVDPMATTFFTTFTYFSTSVIADTTVVTSSMETITSVVSPTPTTAVIFSATAPGLAETSTARVIDVGGSPNKLSGDLDSDKVQSTGLLSTIRSTEVNSGVATLFTTQVIGTFINGQYARIMESSSEVLPSIATIEGTPPVQPSRLPTGVVSINVASVYDIDHPVTTVFTTRVVGVYSDNVYSTTTDQTRRVEIDGDKTVPPQDPSRTGLIRMTTGTIIAESTTTIYQTKVIGTFLNGLYAEVLESSTSVVADNSLPPTVIIAATGVEFVEPTVLTKPIEGSVAEIEGSIVSTTSENTDGILATKSIGILGLGVGGRGRITSRLSVSSRSKTFTPVIRPFNRNRNRPAVVQPVESTPVQSVSSIRSTTNRFSRPSIAITPTTRNSPGFSRSQFFRPRSSFQPSGIVSPTPVSGFAGVLSSSRRVIVSAGPRSTFGGFNNRLRPSGFPSGSLSSSGGSSSLFSSSRRFAFPSRNKNVEAAKELETDEVPETTDQPDTTEVPEDIVASEIVDGNQDGDEKEIEVVEEVVVEVTTPRPVSGFRRPSPLLTNSRRQFPLARPSASTTESSRDSVPTTTKPRFRRPTKLPFTIKPKEVVSIRPAPRRLPFGRSRLTSKPEIEENSSEAADEVVNARQQRRSKRQANKYEEYFYDSRRYKTTERPSRKRSPQRSSTTSRQSRPSGSRRLKPSTTFNDDYDYEEFEEEEVVVTSRPRSPTRSSSASSLRDRLRAQQQGRTPTRPSSSRTRPTSSSSRFRSSSSSRRRPTSSSASRNKPTSSSSRRPSSSRRRPPFSRPKVPEVFDDEEEPLIDTVEDRPEIIPTPVTVTHFVPVKTVISVNNAAGEPELKTILKAEASTELINSYTTTKIEGTWRYLASEVTASPSPGVTEITQFLLKPTLTSTVTFTPTTIRGRPTSFSHIVPSTAYEIETVVSTISDPVLATNNLLQQLLLGGLNGANPLLGLANAGDGTPTTSFKEITSTYVTTLTEFQSTVFPLTVRGKVFTTTIVGKSSSVITATEISTETIVIEPTAKLAQPNQLVSLLPLLQAQLLNQQQPLLPLLQPQTVQPIETTVAPQLLKEKSPEVQVVLQSTEIFEEPEDVFIPESTPEPEFVAFVESTPSAKIVALNPVPVTPLPVTSVVTLYLSGRFPGEFSSIISTITLDGPDATVVKRQASPSEVVEVNFETSALPYMVETDEGFYKLPEYVQWRDIDYYIASAMNEVEDVGTHHTQSLDGVHARQSEGYQSNAKAIGRKILQFEGEDLLEEEELAFQQFGSRKRSPEALDESEPIEFLPTARKVADASPQRLVPSFESFEADLDSTAEILTAQDDEALTADPIDSAIAFVPELATESTGEIAPESEEVTVETQSLEEEITESEAEIGTETEEVEEEEEITKSPVEIVTEFVPESLPVAAVTASESESESTTESATEAMPESAPEVVTESLPEVAPETETESVPESTTLTPTKPPTREPKKIRVSATKKPIKTPSIKNENVPIISSSKDDEPLTGGSIFAPRVYYTIYSYLYTILNGPNAGSTSSREVSISSIARGRDTIIPSDFQRTESNNGIYFLASGASIADLSTRVRNDLTTQVNLVSVTMVKYGRGRVPSRNPTASGAVKSRPTATSQRTRIRPTQIEPSFETLESSTGKPVAATEKLPSLRQSKTRSSSIRTITTKPADEASVGATQSTSAAPVKNRGRGTVRFNGASASLQRDTVETEPGLDAIRTSAPAARTRSPTRTATVVRTASRSAKKLSSTRSVVRETTTSKVVNRGRRPATTKTTPKPTPVRKIIRTLTRDRLPVVRKPVQELSDDFETSEEVFDDFDEFGNNVFDDEDDFRTGRGSFEYDEYSDELSDDDEFYDDYEYYDDELEEVEEPIFTSSSAFRTGKTLSSTETPAATSTEVVLTPTARIIASTTRNTPIRSTFVRKLVNPLDKHLSSILAHSRSSLKLASATVKPVERESSSINRFRLGLRQSLSATPSPTFSTSTVVLKTFSTTSTLALDGIRNGIELTLLTSTLTTLFDDDLKLLTQSPELFKPVTIQPTPVFRPNSNRLRNTRTRFPFRSSFKRPEVESASENTNESDSVDDIGEPFPTADDILTSTDISSSMEDETEEPSSSLKPEALLPLITLTQVETEFKTYTAVVTRVNGDESLVTTRLEVLPELVTKTIVQAQATSGIHSHLLLPYSFNYNFHSSSLIASF